MRSPEALINPTLLLWARQSSRLGLEEAARKASVAPSRLEAWEVGDAKPTIIQLRKLGRAYRRPIAIFYLPEAPADYQAMRDFRLRQADEDPDISPSLTLEIRRAQERRDIASELATDSELEMANIPFSISLDDDAERSADRIREFLGVPIEEQKAWVSGYTTFNNWRDRFEESGILVFQFSGVNVSEARGFSISEFPLPAIALNIRDAVTARVFTMFHEFAHILLQNGGLCDLRERIGFHGTNADVEVFCNSIAGETLVPWNDLQTNDTIAGREPNNEWDEGTLRLLSNQYGVSEEVIVRRLLTFQMTDVHFYRRKRDEYEDRIRNLREAGRTGFAPPDRTAIARSGPLFTKLVLENYRRDTITGSDVSEYLEVRMKHISKIEASLHSS